MKRISSKTTWFDKRVFPVVWFGSLAAAVGIGVVTTRGHAPLGFWLFPIPMAGFGYLLMKSLVLDLADEVWDAGSELVVRNAGREERIALSDIVNVSHSALTRPQRVTLTLRRSTAFGREITFAAPTVWVPFAKSTQIAELIQRVDQARESRR